MEETYSYNARQIFTADQIHVLNYEQVTMLIGKPYNFANKSSTVLSHSLFAYLSHSLLSKIHVTITSSYDTESL